MVKKGLMLLPVLSWKFPFSSVVVVRLVPLMVTVAPASGLPYSSVTFPLTVWSWALAPRRDNANRNSSRHFFIQAMFLVYKPHPAALGYKRTCGTLTKPL